MIEPSMLWPRRDRTYEQMADFVGTRIASGCSRSVYLHKSEDHLVVKVIRDWPDYANIMEYMITERFFMYNYVTDWTAPITEISTCGRIAFQRRTTPLTREELPSKVPSWMTDLKRSNFGRLVAAPGERYPNVYPVAHDYASHLMFEKGTPRRLMTARWRDDGEPGVRE